MRNKQECRFIRFISAYKLSRRIFSYILMNIMTTERSFYLCVLSNNNVNSKTEYEKCKQADLKLKTTIQPIFNHSSTFILPENNRKPGVS